MDNLDKGLSSLFVSWLLMMFASWTVVNMWNVLHTNSLIFIIKYYFQGRRTSRTAPIVIRQALHSGDGDITIWGTEIMIVSIVARIRNIRMQSTKITYTIQDITGRMRAVFWLDQEAMEEDVSLFWLFYISFNSVMTKLHDFLHL